MHGAAGGVGTAIRQLGRLQGLEMYGTASAGKHDLVRELGVTPVDHKSDDFAERIRSLTGDGVDAVFDAVGGENAVRSRKTLRRGGRPVVYGLSLGLDGGVNTTGLVAKQRGSATLPA